MKKIFVIGAGIAGLSAGIYARQSGFDVTIYESHSIPGGASTSWRRKGYYFEGGLHWLTGSSPKTELNKLWREVGALDDSVKIHNRDPFFHYEMDGKRASLYRDIDMLKHHLTNLSPVDKQEIDRVCVGKIAVWDVATPLTYERYLSSYKGSWMTLTKKGQGNVSYSGKPESIQNLYFAGQRLMSPGGLPVALMTGRTAVQYLCLDTDTVFQGTI